MTHGHHMYFEMVDVFTNGGGVIDQPLILPYNWKGSVPGCLQAS
jgi:hypothetical protein